VLGLLTVYKRNKYSVSATEHKPQVLYIHVYFNKRTGQESGVQLVLKNLC